MTGRFIMALEGLLPWFLSRAQKNCFIFIENIAKLQIHRIFFADSQARRVTRNITKLK
jgi:hypothetical protein